MVRTSAAARATRPTPGTTSIADEVTAAVGRRLARLEARLQRQGRSLAELGPPDVIADRLVGVLPDPSPWDDAIGPFHTPASVCRLLGTSRQAVADRRARRRILAVRAADGVWLYPDFQFGPSGRLLTGLADVLASFDEERVDGWTLAAVLVAPQRELDGLSIVQWLREGHDPTIAVALARSLASSVAG